MNCSCEMHEFARFFCMWKHVFFCFSFCAILLFLLMNAWSLSAWTRIFIWSKSKVAQIKNWKKLYLGVLLHRTFNWVQTLGNFPKKIANSNSIATMLQATSFQMALVGRGYLRTSLWSYGSLVQHRELRIDILKHDFVVATHTHTQNV